MTASIQLDAAYCFQQAVLTETYRALSKTHGGAFAAYFIAEHKEQVLRAAKTWLCGQSEAAVRSETLRLKNSNFGA